MSRRRRRNNRVYSKAKPPQRVYQNISRKRRLRRYSFESAFKIQPIEDRRYYTPQEPGYRTITGAPARVVPQVQPKISQRRYAPERLKFKDPRRAMVCVRRSSRRESLFALNKIGKGKAGPKRRKITESSKISCRR